MIDFFSQMPYFQEIATITVVAIFMAISPGADFVMVTRNSIFYSRKAGIYSSLGVSMAIWVHVAYSIAGLAVIISSSVVLFSILKYLGAAYLIYIGWKTFTSKAMMDLEKNDETANLSITNVLNPKTTIFFLSIFTQIVTLDTPIFLQLIYGLIISLAHFIWFGIISCTLTHPVLLKKFQASKHIIEKVVGTVLIGFGIKVALVNNN